MDAASLIVGSTSSKAELVSQRHTDRTHTVHSPDPACPPLHPPSYSPISCKVLVAAIAWCGCAHLLLVTVFVNANWAGFGTPCPCPPSQGKNPADARVLLAGCHAWGQTVPAPSRSGPPSPPHQFWGVLGRTAGAGGEGKRSLGRQVQLRAGSGSSSWGGGRRNVSKGRAGGDHPGAPCPHAGGSPGHCVWGGLRLQPCMPAPEGHELRLGPGCTDKGTPWEETCLGWAGTGTPP